MAELLRAQGYQTAAVVANTAYLTRSIGFAQGFDYYDDRPALPFLRNAAQYTFAQRIRNVIVRFFRPGVFERETRDATTITDEATKIIRARRPDRPFLLFLNYLDAHHPYVPSPPYDRMFGPSIDTVDPEEYVEAGKRAPSQSVRRVCLSQYDGAIREIDDQLQRLAQELRRQQLWDNTLIVITSDHGEELESGPVGHGRALTEHEIHIPLLAKFPDQQIGNRRPEKVSLIDVLPTVLRMTGHEYVNQLPGLDLRGPIASDRAVFSEHFQRDDRRSVACVKQHRKIVLDINGQWSLIDRDTNPPRTIYEPAETALLRAAIEHWMGITPIYKGLNERGIIESQELRALGYLR
jgi:arylsulfatase A-like enzyme